MILTMSLIACNMSKDLSRGEAEKILKNQNLGFEIGTIPAKTVKIFDIINERFPDKPRAERNMAQYNKYVEDMKAYLNPMQNAGLIEIIFLSEDRRHQSGLEESGYFSYQIQQTSVAPYLLIYFVKHWKVIVCKFVLDEITGITNISENKAQFITPLLNIT